MVCLSMRSAWQTRGLRMKDPLPASIVNKMTPLPQTSTGSAAYGSFVRS